MRSKHFWHLPCFTYNGYEWDIAAIDGDDKEIELFNGKNLVCLANGSTLLSEAVLFNPDWAKPHGLFSFFHTPQIEGHIRWGVSEKSTERLEQFLDDHSGGKKLEALYIGTYYNDILDSWRKGYQQWKGWPKIKKEIREIYEYTMEVPIYDSAHWWLTSVNINKAGIDWVNNLSDFWSSDLDDVEAEIAKNVSGGIHR